MITMRDRVRRPIQANIKRFIFVVVVFSLALCLLGQIALSFYCFYDSHRGVMGDEVSVFLDSSLTDAQRKKAQDQIRALAPITELREIKPTDVLEKDILKLVGDRKKIPTILALQFPSDTRYIDIEGAVKSIEKVRGVEGVTANLEWIKKRHSLREAIALGMFAFGAPAATLVCLLIFQNSLRLSAFLRSERELLLMLGASDWAVRGPQMIAAAVSSVLGCVIGGVLLLVTTLASVPLLEEAFELTLMPHWSVFAAVYLSVFLVTILLSVIVSYFIAGATTPRTF